MLTLVGCQDNIYKESLMCHDKAQPLRNKAIFLKKRKEKKRKKEEERKKKESDPQITNLV